MHLEDAVLQMVVLGERDPLDIARKVIDRNGNDWVAAELAAHAEDFIADLARRTLGQARRNAEVALRPGDMVAESRMQLAKFWIPGEGWKQAAELTAQDLRKRADWYGMFRRAALRREQWCRETATLMDTEGVQTLGELRVPLPALPDDDELGALPTAV